jgi:membrane-bound lytic murein transglycosylase D
MELRSAFPLSVALGALLGVGIVALDGPESSPAPQLAIAAVRTLTQPPVQFDLPIVPNSSVQRFVSLFRDEQPDRMALYLKRSGRYEGMIRAKLRARGMPEDLVYLSMIESGFNPNARSRVSAVGLWQFMAPTARDYGLRVDGYVDERRDPEKSTDAALEYLEDLYEEFGAWNLAAAAYNAGAGRVARAMREVTGGERGDEADFWRIRRRLPADTREYVPLIFAAALVGKEPHKYGLDGVERLLPLPTDTVVAPGGTDLERLAEQIGATEDELRQLNPHLVRGATPPGESYPVIVPDGAAERFTVARAASPAQAAAAPPSSGPETHRVQRGESLSEIAAKHGVTVAALQRANGMGRRTILQPGQLLRLPV